MAGKMIMALGRDSSSLGELLLSSSESLGNSQASSVLLATPVVSSPIRESGIATHISGDMVSAIGSLIEGPQAGFNDDSAGCCGAL